MLARRLQSARGRTAYRDIWSGPSRGPGTDWPPRHRVVVYRERGRTRQRRAGERESQVAALVRELAPTDPRGDWRDRPDRHHQIGHVRSPTRKDMEQRSL